MDTSALQTLSNDTMTGTKFFILSINHNISNDGQQQMSPCSTSPSSESSSASLNSINVSNIHSKIITFGYCILNFNNNNNEEEKIEIFDSLNLRNDIETLGQLASECNAILSPNEDIRQILHPLAANIRDEAFHLNQCFYDFINIDPILLHFYTTQNNYNNECQSTILPISSTTSIHDKIKIMISAVKNNDLNNLHQHIENVQYKYQPAVCVDNYVDNGLVVRTRGLPWQASDQDVASFFAGLNIAPGGVALCLSPDGRRNGEAIVRFESKIHREMALARHRQFLHNRYIEVYRATGDDFLKVAVGSDIQAVQFASRQAAMIIRMRGLPFDCTEAQIEQFFSSDNESSGIIEQGIMFVQRPDGRPSGDAFVLFVDEASGKRALAKHKNRIGSRYIELFRTTQAEVQQVFNRTRAITQPQLPYIMPTVLTHPKRDCIRLRGLPYEAAVKDVAEFLGPHARRIAFQGVHMIYNNQGHPSGECFIQMDSESSAASTAMSMHNKYMEIGKKKRYIEVFQCSADDIANILNSSSGQGSPNGSTSSSTTAATTGTIYPNPLLQPLPIQTFRTAPPTQMGLMNPLSTAFYPQTALTPEQLLFAQFNHIPMYTPDQLQLAQLDTNALIQQQIAAAQFQQQLNAAATINAQNPGNNVSTGEFVPINSTLIHT